MRVLITAGPTREPIDPVRYIGNRSSGKMGAALAAAAIAAGHEVTLIVGPVSAAIPTGIRRIDIETAAQMHAAVLREFPEHELLIMAAAVADFRPVRLESRKLSRGQAMSIECEPTEDIVAAAGATKRPDQRIVGFSLEARGDIDRAREKLVRKNLDMVVYNPIETMESQAIEPVLLWRDGRSETPPGQGKGEFAKLLLDRSILLFNRKT
ncbi:MAG TPA: phosphopantothenoylcysteine decarboxylase [Humisphaera sp.]|jgi:phosphopantothenoylcysteine decarboxylase/phosphopantothenate--cysteine ligase|nr:phosphopantothenoylcysteine decarboxylase [Humisphaera sp.]